MAGKSTNTLWTYLTPRRVYRYQVAAADSAPGGSLPVIHADRTTNASGTVSPPAGTGNGSGFGSNTTLALSVVVHSGTSAKVNVYMRANAEGVGYADTPEVYANLAFWVLVHSEVVSANKLINLPNMPAAKYCATVTDIAGDAVVSILEQHTE